jgi:hypothetical protein
MKTLHIMDISEFVLLNGRCKRNSAYILLSGTTILAITQFEDEGAAQEFMQKAKTASHLPHPVYNPAVLLTDTQAAAIAQNASLFPDATTPAQRLAIAKTLNVGQVARRAGRLHPHLNLSVF